MDILSFVLYQLFAMVLINGYHYKWRSLLPMLTIVALAWSGSWVLWLPCAFCLCGRRARVRHDRPYVLAAYITLGDSMVRLYGCAIDDLHSWLFYNSISADVRTLALMPASMCCLLVLYGDIVTIYGADSVSCLALFFFLNTCLGLRPFTCSLTEHFVRVGHSYFL